MIDYRAARLRMTDGQLRTNKVTDEAVLDAFLALPRERFVPAHLRGIAYIDEDLPLGDDRYLLEPMVLARLLQLAELRPTDRVLEIGAGSGYAAALLARLAGAVVAVESNERLLAVARRLLPELGLGKVALIAGKLEEGHAAGAPYDVIVIDGAVAAVPDALAHQLAPEGRLVTVLKPRNGLGHAVLMTRVGNGLSGRPVFDAGTPSLPGFLRAPSFVF